MFCFLFSLPPLSTPSHSFLSTERFFQVNENKQKQERVSFLVPCSSRQWLSVHAKHATCNYVCYFVECTASPPSSPHAPFSLHIHPSTAHSPYKHTQSPHARTQVIQHTFTVLTESIWAARLMNRFTNRSQEGRRREDGFVLCCVVCS